MVLGGSGLGSLACLSLFGCQCTPPPLRCGCLGFWSRGRYFFLLPANFYYYYVLADARADAGPGAHADARADSTE